MLRKYRFYWLSIGISLFMSCQSGKEFHYFKEGDNYYRLRVRERAFLSSSRYQSGHYDESAVDNYFSEIRRPDSTGQVIPVKVLDPSGKTISQGSTKLVMILSTNAEAVAEQIGNLAENEQTLELMARFTNKDIQNENIRLKQELSQKQNKDAALIEFGNSTLAAIPDTDKTKAKLNQTKNIILAFVNSLAASTGRKQPFTELEQAQNWFYETF